MNNKSSDRTTQPERRPSEPTRRAVLAAGGAVALSGLAGCSALDSVLNRAGEAGTKQLVGTTVSSPAAFYAGQAPPEVEDADSDDDGLSDGDELQFFVGGDTEVREVPATVRADSREIDLGGWSTSGATKAQDYGSSRSNKSHSEWWVGPDDDADGDGFGDVLVAIQDVQLDLLAQTAAAAASISKRSARTGRNVAAMDDSNQDARATAERCSEDVCQTILENADDRERLIGRTREHVDNEEWDQAAAAVDEVRDIVLGDIERLDDELEDRRPSRPRFSDLIEYLDDEPTIGERFTICLPDAKLPGDRGSLAEELTLDRVLAYFAASYEKEEGGRHTPFHNRYRPQFDANYDDDGCIQTDDSVSLHEDLACQNILSAKLDTYTTENRGIVGYGTEDGAVVSAAPAPSDAIGKRVFLASDVTGEIILGEDRDMVTPGNDDISSGSQTLVCPVTVTPEDSPTPLPGLFSVRRIVHDDQIIFAGGWVLDDGALYENSATLLFDEGPTEVASVTLEDIESDDYEDRIVEQFSRERSQHGSAVTSANLDAVVEYGGVPKAMLTSKLDSVLETADNGDDGSDDPIRVTATALDAPLVHLAGASELSSAEKEDTIGLLLRGIDKKDIRR